MRFAAVLLAFYFVLAGSGCLVVGAAVAAVSAVAVTTVKTAGKVTAATVETTGRVASAAVSSSGEVTALTLESAAKLARTGMVVVVDGSSGATTALPWSQGMSLATATQATKAGAVAKAVKIFRDGRG